MKKYTKEQILLAGKIGEISLIDVKHLISLLDEAVELESYQNSLIGIEHFPREKE